MRFILLFITASITTALCFLLDSTILFQVPIGRLLSPQEGIWQNAESVNEDFSESIHLPQLKGRTTVYFDDRLVPHVFADNPTDLYFVQGFLHAKFRLWQMELQTLSAAGRASEVVGEVALSHDREFRRLGMVYAAENSLAAMEQDPETKSTCDAYTAGVNAYIHTLTRSSLPIEYKLLNCEPEKWSNFKTALFLKYMSYTLSGYDNDFEMTNAKSYFKKSDFDKLFPYYQDSTLPIIQKGTVFENPSFTPQQPAFADSIYFNFLQSANSVSPYTMPDKSNGSNNWALAPKRTKSGAPILCNDPHLALNLPSLWYEMQLSSPENNVYGVSFPGAPSIIIGFNNSCSFGFTNAGRDVKDYYEIKFKDASKSLYWFDSAWHNTQLRIERIKIKGKPDFVDTVAYTVFGPVIYDNSFGGKMKISEKNYAVKWAAHDSSNELKLFCLLDRVKNHDEYVQASTWLKNPGQNIVFASKNGDIAMRVAGRFPVKWKGQGDFVMPGFDSSYMWHEDIPSQYTPFQYNPDTGYVSSANQRPVDSTYPYYIGRDYPPYRGFYLNKRLAEMREATIAQMMALQTDNLNIFASMALPMFAKNISKELLTEKEKQQFSILLKWNCKDDPASTEATLFELLWKNFSDTILNDEFSKAPNFTKRPYESNLLEAILKDSTFSFIDNIHTTEVETLKQMATAAFKKALSKADFLKKEHRLEWAKYKDTHIDHLLKLEPFGWNHLAVGGGTNVLNAIKSNHGPSWRMIVQLSAQTKAYGIYPGGQSGNPGSRFYDNMIQNWVQSKYYELWMMKESEASDNRVKWRMHFSG